MFLNWFLARKKDYEDEFGEIDVDENGGMNIYVKMYGPASNPKITYDGAGAKQNHCERFKRRD